MSAEYDQHRESQHSPSRTATLAGIVREMVAVARNSDPNHIYEQSADEPDIGVKLAA